MKSLVSEPVSRVSEDMLFETWQRPFFTEMKNENDILKCFKIHSYIHLTLQNCYWVN